MARGPDLDTFISAADRALRALLAPPAAGRPLPVQKTKEKPDALPRPALSPDDRRESAALMRVNHAGEVAAQALYHAQALFARDAKVREFMLHAAREETDHLAWCETRLKELGPDPACLIRSGMQDLSGSAPSRLCSAIAPALVSWRKRSGRSKAISRGISTAFRPTTCAAGPSSKPCATTKSGMAEKAQSAGAASLPGPVRELMRRTASIMTHTSYRF